jgi:DNA modification methylase
VGEGRKYIGIEKNEQIYNIAIDRISGYINID